MDLGRLRPRRQPRATSARLCSARDAHWALRCSLDCKGAAIMSTLSNPQDILLGFFDVLHALQGIAHLGCGPHTLDCTEPGDRFGKLAGLLAKQQAALCRALEGSLAAQEHVQTTITRIQ